MLTDIFFPLLLAQDVSLRGRLSDPSGALVPNATITATGPASAQAQTNGRGEYVLGGLRAGLYQIEANAPGLVARQSIRLTAGARTLDLVMQLAATEQKLDIAPEPETLALEPSRNASALVLRGDQLNALGDKPEDLLADLQAIAGPSAGPRGAGVYVDGFAGGSLPSKDAIREIRISANPFAPEYDRMGMGRVDIFTKPGTEKFKGLIYYNFADAATNSRNPYAGLKAPFRLHEYGGSASGSLGKKSSYFVDTRRDDIINGAIINGAALNPVTLAVIDPFTAVFPTHQKRFSLTPRVDWQWGKNHTLTARHVFLQATVDGAAIGNANPASRGTNTEHFANTTQISDVAVISARTVNEFRLQLQHIASRNTARVDSPALIVLGALNAGGAQVGRSRDTNFTTELQNYVTQIRGAHTLRFGVRLRTEAASSFAPVNFGGTFTFAGGGTSSLSSLERYRLTLRLLREGLSGAEIRARGGGAAQFTRNAGDPFVDGAQLDAGFFFGDDWKARRNLTLSIGARQEFQTNLGDATNFAPRMGLAWSPGKAKNPAGVVRLGFGGFYDRLPLAQTLATRRFDGARQRQWIVADPDTYPLAPGTLNGGAPIVQAIDAGLRAPRLWQTAAGYERALPRRMKLAATYINTTGQRLFRSSATPPVFTLQSPGEYLQHQMLVSMTADPHKRVSLFGSYVLGRARSDTEGVGTFPANPRDLRGEYGPADTDIRHRGTLGGTLALWRDVRLNPLFTLNSGAPFNIISGQDTFGTTVFNARPAVLDAARPGAILTPYGWLDPRPRPGDALLGRNAGRGPGFAQLNLRISKTFSFGFGEGREAPSNIPGGGERRADGGVFGTGGGGPGKTKRRFNVNLSVSIRNLLNRNNPGPLNGNLTSPLFGRATQPANAIIPGGAQFSEDANNRRFEFQSRFTF